MPQAYKQRIVLVEDRVGNSISSSAVRAEVEAGRTVRYLVPEPVLAFMQERRMYTSSCRKGAG